MKNRPHRAGPRERDAFSGYHPTVALLYFVCVLGFGTVLMHPASLGISLACALSYTLYLNGGRAVRLSVRFLLPMLVLTAAFGPLFNHQGGTILAYLPSGNPLTLESAVYGVAAASMLGGVILWCSCLNIVMTSDKLVYLFGRIIPALSLIFSMTLRFVPRFKAQLAVITAAQKGLGRDVSSGTLMQRARHGVRILSIMVTWALENAIETADSMRARGFGLPGRTAFALYRLERRDARALLALALCAIYLLIGCLTGGLHFRYFPTVGGVWGGLYTASLLAAYLAIGAMPLILNAWEEIKWKKHASRVSSNT